MLKSKKSKPVVFKLESKNGFFAVFKLFNKYYLKSFFGPFFSFVFPIIILAILGSLMPIQLIFPGIVAMTSMSVGTMGMPLSILEIKQSVLLKRIGASPIKPKIFTFVIITYFLFVMILAMFWIMLWGIILNSNNDKLWALFDNLSSIKGFFGFFIGNISNIVLSLSIGFLVATIAKNPVKAQAISMMIYFPSAFLSGQFIDIGTITSSPFMNVISQLIPFRYTSMQVIASFNGENIFSYSDISFHHVIQFSDLASRKYETKDLLGAYKGMGIGTIPNTIISNKGAIPLLVNRLAYKSWEVIVAFIYPLTLSLAAITLAIKKFRWSTRN